MPAVGLLASSSDACRRVDGLLGRRDVVRSGLSASWRTGVPLPARTPIASVDDVFSQMSPPEAGSCPGTRGHVANTSARLRVLEHDDRPRVPVLVLPKVA